MGARWWARHARTVVRGTGTARADAGAVAVSGIVHGDVTVLAGPVARSGYLQQVARIAPDRLLGREAELAELDAFCAASDGARYLWWRAPAWAGKTALLSWFVLHPPQGVRIVPFFVTGRFAAQNDRVAFTEVVMEQLAELLGQPMPTYLTEATREAHLLRLLEEAAGACRARGQRLILLVDGLDEDRGVTTGPDAYSIAALLPARPPGDVRVVAAGRPSPAVPVDVPENHPLRDPRVVRPLSSSPHAAAVRVDAERELKRLLYATSTERDLLGLAAAAGSGLTAADFAELTGCSAYDVGQLLQAVSGRTFTVRAGHRRAGAASEVYVLGHEELQAAAVEILGEQRLSGYRDRLHRWAAAYRGGGWPPGTPEYLFGGYFRMLRATADLPRMVAWATDAARHDRMLDSTGGDAAAFAEIAAAQDLILASPDPDLLAMARLAAHRDALADRNRHFHALPAVWAVLGYPERAEAAARSIDESDLRLLALAEAAKAVAVLGDRDRASRLADIAEGLAVRCTDFPYWQARGAAAAAEALAAAGHGDRAAAMVRRIEALARTATEWREQLEVRGALAVAVAACGDRARAAELADSIEEAARSSTQAYWKSEVAAAVASGDQARAAALADVLRVLARTVDDPAARADVSGMLDAAEAASGGRPHDAALVGGLEALANSTTVPFWQIDAVEALAAAVVAAGERERAAALAEVIGALAGIAGLPYWQDPACRTLLDASVLAVATSGDRGRAAALADTLERLAEASSTARFPALGAAAQAAALCGDFDRAEKLVGLITEPYEQGEALAKVARQAAAAGDRGRAVALAGAAESIARTVIPPGLEAKALGRLAVAVAAGGDRGRAAALAAAVEDLAHIAHPDLRADAMVALVAAVAAAGDLDRAEGLVQTIPHSYPRGEALAALAHAATKAGDYDRAEALIRAIPVPTLPGSAARRLAEAVAATGDFDRAEALAVGFFDDAADCAENLVAVARAAADAGDHARAARLAGAVRDLAHAATDPEVHERAVVCAVEAEAVSGCRDEAEALARTITKPYPMQRALVALMRAAVAAGDHDEGEALLVRAEACAASLTSVFIRSLALADLAESMAGAGWIDRAVAQAESIPLPGWQARAFRAVAAQADAATARLLIARALRLGHWEESLHGLAMFAPSVPAALADERTAGHSPRAAAAVSAPDAAESGAQRESGHTVRLSPGPDRPSMPGG